MHSHMHESLTGNMRFGCRMAGCVGVLQSQLRYMGLGAACVTLHIQNAKQRQPRADAAQASMQCVVAGRMCLCSLPGRFALAQAKLIQACRLPAAHYVLPATMNCWRRAMKSIIMYCCKRLALHGWHFLSMLTQGTSIQDVTLVSMLCGHACVLEHAVETWCICVVIKLPCTRTGCK